MGKDSDSERRGSKLLTSVTCEVGAMVMLIFQTRKPRHRAVKGLVQGHTATKWQRRDAHQAEGSRAPSPLCPAEPTSQTNPFPLPLLQQASWGSACTRSPGPQVQVQAPMSTC